MKTEEKLSKHINPAKLLELFERQIVLGEELLLLLGEEKTALIEMDMQALLSLSQKKEHQLLRLKNLDGALQEESRRLWPDSNEKVIRLAALTPFVSEAENDRLASYRDRLAELRKNIDEKNLFNKQFAEDTGKFLNDAIQLISNAVAERPIYSTKGTHKQLASRANLLSREV
ncbi:MAG: flagellar protein FlgN [Desulfobulbaceae bacterium]|nr:flagellar protein FlgN [Desulfobulbaceae bacterium]